MTCESGKTATPGQPFEFTGITAPNDEAITIQRWNGEKWISMAPTIGGSAPSSWTVTFSGSQVQCPGPIRVSVSGVEVDCANVSPC